MSENSLQRYKARRAFQSLKEDKQMSNSEYVKLRSVIQNVKETRKDVVVVDSVVAAVPQNFVYVFILDDTFNDSTSRVTGTSDTHNVNRYITDITVDISNGYTIEDPVSMSTYAADSGTLEDMIIKFDADILDKTNFYHYIKVHTDGVELSSVTTGTLATNIRTAIDKSISDYGSVDNDTIIKRVIVGHGTEEIKSAYYAAYAATTPHDFPSYIQYKNKADETTNDHIYNVDAVITSINGEGTPYMGDYSSSNTIVLYPHNTEVSGAAEDPATYEYSGNASLYFRTLMTEQNNDKYTLLYTEWSAVRVTSLSPFDAVYISVGVNTLTPATHYSLGANLAALE